MDTTRARRAEMCRMAESCMTIAAIARHFGLHRGTVDVGIAQYKRAIAGEERAKAILLNVKSGEDFLRLDVDALEVSVRARNCLKNYRINTVGELIATPDNTLLRTPNFGMKSFLEVKEAINALADRYGFSRPATPIKNIEPKKRKPADVLKHVTYALRQIADQPKITRDDLLNFARQLEEEMR